MNELRPGEVHSKSGITQEQNRDEIHLPLIPGSFLPSVLPSRLVSVTGALMMAVQQRGRVRTRTGNRNCKEKGAALCVQGLWVEQAENEHGHRADSARTGQGSVGDREPSSSYLSSEEWAVSGGGGRGYIQQNLFPLVKKEEEENKNTSHK